MRRQSEGTATQPLWFNVIYANKLSFIAVLVVIAVGLAAVGDGR